MIKELLYFLLVLLFGQQQNNSPKYDLRKQEKQSWFKGYLQRTSPIWMCLLVILLMAAFIFICFTVVGASGVESGNMYNHLKDVI